MKGLNKKIYSPIRLIWFTNFLKILRNVQLVSKIKVILLLTIKKKILKLKEYTN